ncbi:Rof/RNase P-like protein [Geopyxis carbonaria]|nr:Rof/RNase P-like protein [Geopyxis carbonaria]
MAATTPIPAALKPLHDLISAHYPAASVPSIISNKLSKQPFPLLPTSTSAVTPLLNARDKRRAAAATKKTTKHKRPQPLTARERRALQVHKIPAIDATYDKFRVLHELWLSYARELVSLGGGASAMAGRVAAGDLHGAEVEVVRCRCVDRVGIRGIVVKETKCVLEIVRREGGLRHIPKEGTVFRVEVLLDEPSNDGKAVGEGEAEAETVKAEERKMVFDIHGSMFMFRAAERAGKKFKSKPMFDL